MQTKISSHAVTGTNNDDDDDDDDDLLKVETCCIKWYILSCVDLTYMMIILQHKGLSRLNIDTRNLRKRNLNFLKYMEERFGFLCQETTTLVKKVILDYYRVI